MKANTSTRFALVFALLPSLSFSATIFSPDPSRTDGQTEFPFFPRGSASSRWQQVYGAGDFAAITNGGGIVTAISFEGNVPFGATLTNVQIYLSTTAAAPDSLSPVFAENIGFNEVLVHGGPLVIQQSGSGYNWRIDLTAPYYYNPTLGNLLLDIKQFGRFPIPPFPPFYGIETSLSPTDRASAALSFDVNSPVADSVTTGSLLTMFTVTPVPEPSSVLLVSVALGFIIFWRVKDRKG